jgi:predicted DNA-binding transcriptional regulator AlpA
LAPQRQGDRGDVDDAAVALPVFIKFRDLVAAGIVSNWPTLARLIDEEGFPAGILLGKNTRAFRLDEVQAWLDTRPTERKVVSRRVSEQQPEA